MELKFSTGTTILELKKQFSGWFPYLKLEFFPEAHGRREGSGLQQKINDDVCLTDVTTFTGEGAYAFRPSVSVSAFEQHLQNVFGLPVQVFRKAGPIWLETTQTDSRSLEEQNSMGEASAKPLRFNINSLFL